MFIHMDTAFIFSSGIPFCEKKNNISSLPLEVSSGRSPSLAKLTAYTRHLTQLNCKEIQPVHSKGDQPWVFFGRSDAKAETPLLWPPHAKS